MSKYSKTYLYIFLIFLSYLQVVMESLNQTVITSICFHVVVIGSVVLWIIYDSPRRNKYNSLILFIAVISVICLFINALSRGIFNISYYKKFVFFLAFLMINSAVLTGIDLQILRVWLFRFNTICSLIYIYLFYTDRVTMFHRSNVLFSEYLTLNLENPNKASLFIVYFLIINIFLLMENRSIIRKCFSIILVSYFTAFILLTGSRNGQLVSAFFILMLVFYHNKREINTKGFNIFIAASPFVFAIIYLLTIEAVVRSGRLDFLVSAGKELTSRQEIWSISLNRLGGNFLWGSFLRYINPVTGTFQLHNTHIDVLCSYGAIVLILYVLYLNALLTDLADSINYDHRRVRYYTAFVATIMMGFAEAAAVNGTNGYFVLCSVFIALGMNKENAIR